MIRVIYWGLCLFAFGCAHSRDGASHSTFPPAVDADREELSYEMGHALALYDSTKFAESLVELRKVTAGKTSDNAIKRARATFFVGKCLFNLERYEESLAVFARIADAGAVHPYYAKTLLWLLSLHRVAPIAQDDSGAVAYIAKYPLEVLLQPYMNDPMNERLYATNHRDQALYLAGAWWMHHGDAKRGNVLLSRIPSTSPWFDKARKQQPMLPPSSP